MFDKKFKTIFDENIKHIFSKMKEKKLTKDVHEILDLLP